MDVPNADHRQPMTSNTDKLRAVFLTALMIGSVFAAGIAFTGSAAAVESVDAGVSAEDATIPVGDSGSQSELHNVTIDYELNGSEVVNGTLDVSELENTGVSINGVTATASEYTVTEDTYTEADSEVTFQVENASGTTATDTVDLELDLSTEDGETDNRVNLAYTDDNGTDTSFHVKTIDFETSVDDTQDDAEVFAGQVITFENSSQETTPVEVFSTDSDGDKDSRVANLVTNPGYAINYNTENLDEGEYIVEWNDGQNTTNLTISDLGLTAELQSDSVNNEQSITVDTSSNEPLGTYNAYVYEAGADIAEDDPVTEKMGEEFDGSGEDTVSFAVDGDDISAGNNYTVVVEHDSSGVTAQTAEVEVTEAADSSTEFVNVEPAARGDVATVNVSMTQTTEANITIGEYEDSNYEASFTVTDGNEDGYVEFNVNTYTMGNQTGDVQDAFYVPGDSDDTVSNVELVEGSTLSEPIADGTYRTSVRASGADNADDVSRLSITEAAGFTGQNIWTAPRSDNLADFPNDATLTQDSSITQGDWVVHEIEGEGVFGILANASDNGEYSDAQALLNATNNSELSLTVEQTEASVGPNADPKTLNYTEALQNENATVVADAENGTIYVAAALDQVNVGEEDPELSFGDDAFNASVTLNGSTTNLADEDSTTSAEFSTEELSESLTQDVYNVTNADNQTLTAESNAADGTEYNLLVESTETEGDGFIQPENTATVEDGELTFEVDFTEATVGDEFSATLEGLDDDYSATGNVVESVDDGNETTTTADDETTTADDETTTTEDETTTTDDGGDETTTTDETGDDGGDDGGETGGSIPGFGVGIALVALLGAALLALRE